MSRAIPSNGQKCLRPKYSVDDTKNIVVDRGSCANLYNKPKVLVAILFNCIRENWRICSVDSISVRHRCSSSSPCFILSHQTFQPPCNEYYLAATDPICGWHFSSARRGPFPFEFSAFDAHAPDGAFVPPLRTDRSAKSGMGLSCGCFQFLWVSSVFIGVALSLVSSLDAGMWFASCCPCGSDWLAVLECSVCPAIMSHSSWETYYARWGQPRRCLRKRADWTSWFRNRVGMSIQLMFVSKVSIAG